MMGVVTCNFQPLVDVDLRVDKKLYTKREKYIKIQLNKRHGTTTGMLSIQKKVMYSA